MYSFETSTEASASAVLSFIMAGVKATTIQPIYTNPDSVTLIVCKTSISQPRGGKPRSTGSLLMPDHLVLGFLTFAWIIAATVSVYLPAWKACYT